MTIDRDTLANLSRLASATSGLVPLGADKQPLRGYRTGGGDTKRRWRGGAIPDGCAAFGWYCGEAGLRCLDVDSFAGTNEDGSPGVPQPATDAIVSAVAGILRDGAIPHVSAGSTRGGHLYIPAADPAVQDAQVDTTGCDVRLSSAGHAVSVAIDLRGLNTFVAIRDAAACVRAVEGVRRALDPLEGVPGWRGSRTLAQRCADAVVALRARRSGAGRNARHGMAVRNQWGTGQVSAVAWERWFMDRFDGADKRHADRTIGDAIGKGPAAQVTMDRCGPAKPEQGQVDIRRDGLVSIAWADLLAGTVRFVSDRGDWIVFDRQEGWQRGHSAESELRRKFGRFIVRGVQEQLFWHPSGAEVHHLDKEHRKGGVFKELKARREVAILSSALDPIPGLWALPGGLVWDAAHPDQGAHCIREATPDDLATRGLAIAPEWGGGCSAWLEFLEFQMAPDEAQWFMSWVRWVLSGDRQGHVILYVIGEGGTGKTVVRNALFKLLGTTSAGGIAVGINAKNLTEKEDSASQWIARTEGARLAMVEEAKRQRTEPDNLKMLSGGSMATARQHYRADEEFLTRTTVMIVSNHMPVIVGIDTDHGVQRRLRVIRWDRQWNVNGEPPCPVDAMNAQLGAFLALCMTQGDVSLVEEGREPDTMREHKAAVIAGGADTLASVIAALPGVEVATGAERKNTVRARQFGMTGTRHLHQMVIDAYDTVRVEDAPDLPEAAATLTAFVRALRREGFQTRRVQVDGVQQTCVFGVRLVAVDADLPF